MIEAVRATLRRRDVGDAGSWRGADLAETTPPPRGVSTFVFDEDALIQESVDWLDLDRAIRRSEGLGPLLTRRS